MPVEAQDVGAVVGGSHANRLGDVAGLPFFAKQQRFTFARCGVIDPPDIAGYDWRGLRAARTPLVLAAPCDAPNLPSDLAECLGKALDAASADIATVITPDGTGRTTLHPVFALLRTSLADDLSARLAAGERKVRAWYARHRHVEVAFADEHAFYNANSLQELADLERA